MNPPLSALQPSLQGEGHETTSEEKDELQRSTKRVKDSSWEPRTSEVTAPKEPAPTYKDKLAGVIPGAFERAFYIEREYEDDTDDDVDEEAENEDGPRVLFTRKEKLQIRAPWRESLIVKLYGRALEYRLFRAKLNDLWNPKGNMKCVDVGHGFYIVSFECREDRSKVIREGPWFVNGRFLTIRMWEPNFQPSQAKFSAVALWLRLPELPWEYYNPWSLRKITEAIGPLLRVDGYTAMAERANFARVCVQLNTDKPLPKSIRIGDRKQSIQYEGINTLCFECGIIGHRRDLCPTLHPGQGQGSDAGNEASESMKENGQTPDSSQGKPLVEGAEDSYGPWTLVSYRKARTPMRKSSEGSSGQGKGPAKGQRKDNRSQRNRQGRRTQEGSQNGSLQQQPHDRTSVRGGREKELAGTNQKTQVEDGDQRMAMLDPVSKAKAGELAGENNMGLDGKAHEKKKGLSNFPILQVINSDSVNPNTPSFSSHHRNPEGRSTIENAWKPAGGGSSESSDSDMPSTDDINRNTMELCPTGQTKKAEGYTSRRSTLDGIDISSNRFSSGSDPSPHPTPNNGSRGGVGRESKNSRACCPNFCPPNNTKHPPSPQAMEGDDGNSHGHDGHTQTSLASPTGQMEIEHPGYPLIHPRADPSLDEHGDSIMGDSGEEINKVTTSQGGANRQNLRQTLALARSGQGEFHG